MLSAGIFAPSVAQADERGEGAFAELAALSLIHISEPTRPY